MRPPVANMNSHEHPKLGKLVKTLDSGLVAVLYVLYLHSGP